MRRLLISLAALSLAACDTFYAQLEVPNLCHRLTDQRFTVPDELRARYQLLPDELKNTLSVEKTFEFDVLPEIPEELRHLTADFQLTRLSITAADAQTSFAFVDRASVQVAAPGTSLPPRTFTAAATGDHRTLYWSGEPFDVDAYLTAGTLSYTVEFVGVLPPGDVVADVEVCMSATASLNYLAQ